MPGDQAFVNELRAQWSKNFVIAILFARLNHERIPPEVAGIAQQMNGAFRAQQGINDAVNAAMGSMGIFGGRSGFGFPVNPEEFMFYVAMGLIVAHRGNPPALPTLQAHATGIVSGKLDPYTVYELSASNMPGYAALLRTILPLAGEFAPMLRSWALIMAALAVPWDDIPGLLGIDVSAKKNFETEMQEMWGAVKSGSFDKVQKHFAAAFEAAERTPGVEDDIQAITLFFLLASSGKFEPENVGTAVQKLGRLAVDKNNVDKLAPCVCLAMYAADSAGLVKEFGPELVRIGKALLKILDPKERLLLTLKTAGTLVHLTKTAEAQSLVSGIKGKFTSPDDILEIAAVEAAIRFADGDSNGAADAAIAGIDRGKDGDLQKRIFLLRKLFSVWPDNRAGIETWLGQFKDDTAELEDPQGDVMRMEIALVLFRAGKQKDARAMIETVDLEMVEEKAPALSETVQEATRAFGLGRAS